MQDNDIGKGGGLAGACGEVWLPGGERVSGEISHPPGRRVAWELPRCGAHKPASLLRMLDARGSHIMATGNILNRIQRKLEDWRARWPDNPRHRVSPISRDAAETITAMEVIEATLLKRPAL